MNMAAKTIRKHFRLAREFKYLAEAPVSSGYGRRGLSLRLATENDSTDLENRSSEPTSDWASCVHFVGLAVLGPVYGSRGWRLYGACVALNGKRCQSYISN